jgi:predicted nucleotidyltransferase
MGPRASESAVRAHIERLVERIVQGVHPRQVILFGSLARGDYHSGSDLDVCIIVDRAEGWFERQKRIRKLIHIPGIDVEPHVYTREEFDRMLQEENPLALRIAKEGKTLYEQ